MSGISGTGGRLRRVGRVRQVGVRAAPAIVRQVGQVGRVGRVRQVGIKKSYLW